MWIEWIIDFLSGRYHTNIDIKKYRFVCFLVVLLIESFLIISYLKLNKMTIRKSINSFLSNSKKLVEFPTKVKINFKN